MGRFDGPCLAVQRPVRKSLWRPSDQSVQRVVLRREILQALDHHAIRERQAAKSGRFLTRFAMHGDAGWRHMRYMVVGIAGRQV